MVRSTSSPWPLTFAVTSPPPACPLYLRLGELLLRGHQLLLHLLSRGKQLLHVHLATWVHGAPI